MGLPTALTEEIISPDEVLVTRDDDGTVHLFAYVGEHGDGRFTLLKHIVFVDKHARVFGVQHDDEEEDLAGEEVDLDDLTTCGCGARIMPSGWCTGGHAPKE